MSTRACNTTTNNTNTAKKQRISSVQTMVQRLPQELAMYCASFLIDPYAEDRRRHKEQWSRIVCTSFCVENDDGEAVICVDVCVEHSVADWVSVEYSFAHWGVHKNYQCRWYDVDDH
jgi:hypothetical protein